MKDGFCGPSNLAAIRRRIGLWDYSSGKYSNGRFATEYARERPILFNNPIAIILTTSDEPP